MLCAAGFFKKGTKYRFLKLVIHYKTPFYQKFMEFSHNFSTHLLTVLTIRCIVIVLIEQMRNTEPCIRAISVKTNAGKCNIALEGVYDGCSDTVYAAE